MYAGGAWSSAACREVGAPCLRPGGGANSTTTTIRHPHHARDFLQARLALHRLQHRDLLEVAPPLLLEQHLELVDRPAGGDGLAHLVVDGEDLVDAVRPLKPSPPQKLQMIDVALLVAHRVLRPRDWNSLLTRSGDMFIFRSVSGSGAYSCLHAMHSFRITRPATISLSWLIAFLASPTSLIHCWSASNVLAARMPTYDALARAGEA